MSAGSDSPPVALTIAGSDSGGGAGLQADLKTWEAQGVFGATVITSITAQNTREVRRVEAVATDLVRDQLTAVLEDLPVVAIKTGLLPSVAIVEAVADVLASVPRRPLVVDPVLVATSGDPLADPVVADALWDTLIPLATVLTPNLAEAEVLTGRPVQSQAQMREAAQWIQDRRGTAVLIKGGHLPGAAVDILLDSEGFEEFSLPRLALGPTHGTGCALAAALAGGLARGLPLRVAVAGAKDLVHRALRSSRSLGAGSRVLGFSRA